MAYGSRYRSAYNIEFAAWCRKRDHEVVTMHRPTAAQALSVAISNARKGRAAPMRCQRSGRLDTRVISKVAVGDLRVFKKPGSPGPDKVRVTILVDASSSMDAVLEASEDVTGRTVDHHIWGSDYTRAKQAIQVARDLADATNLLPWVTADVVGFTTFGNNVAVYPLWKTGESTQNLDAYGAINKDQTEEGYAIAYAKDEMQERLRGREQGLIIIVSDGRPGEAKHVRAMVEACKREHIPVVSVALTTSAKQTAMYGKENVVTFDGNVRSLARGMAKVIGRVL